jgi:hypothetical protein
MALADSPSAQPHSDVRRLPLLLQLHDWVVTVDHKRLGLMYNWLRVLQLALTFCNI